jgi:hypothetical protein
MIDSTVISYRDPEVDHAVRNAEPVTFIDDNIPILQSHQFRHLLYAFFFFVPLLLPCLRIIQNGDEFVLWLQKFTISSLTNIYLAVLAPGLLVPFLRVVYVFLLSSFLS